MRLSAIIMLIISCINFFRLVTAGYFDGGKVQVNYSVKAVILQLGLIIFLAFLSFKKYDKTT